MQTLSPFGPDQTDSDKPAVLFAHANGYPPESYRTLLEPLSKSFRVLTVEHRPFWDAGPAPRTQPWTVYADDLLTTLERELDEPLFLLGHSMGAVIGMLAALKNPQRFRGLVALDPVLLPFNIWLPSQILRAVGKELPMVRQALGRPGHFDSHDAAFAFYRSKRPFQRISDDVLWDYVRAGHSPAASGGVDLRWTGDWEACVYRSAPSMFRRLGGLRIPMLGIVGRDSAVFRPESIARWRRAVPEVEVQTVEGGHLVPLENPAPCARLIEEFLSAQSGSAAVD